MSAGPLDARTPVVAVVGRPNVGKSSLVNRIVGRREAVVEDEPGVTRDRVAYDANWAGRSFTVVDTGGWDPGARGLAARVTAQAELAAAAADLVLLVVDATVGATEADAAAAAVLRRSGKPVLLVANKVDSAAVEPEATRLWSLGLGEPHTVSALHGRGSGDLLDSVVQTLPELADVPAAVGAPRRVAIVGRPNVGKSSLLNRLAGTERVLVDEVAGTTRDPVDTEVQFGGETWCLVDTAGLRRRARQASGPEYYSILRTERAVEKAEAAIVLFDASEPLTEQDQRVAGVAVEAGRALVLAMNKWDLVDDERRVQLEWEVERDLGRLSWAPRVNVSARTGRGVDRLAAALRAALGGWAQRLSTAQVNAWLSEVVAATPPPVRGGRQPKILFATQAGTRPPRLVLFTSGPLEAGYLRFLERRLREQFGFLGTPVELTVRPRGRSRRRSP